MYSTSTEMDESGTLLVTLTVSLPPSPGVGFDMLAEHEATSLGGAGGDVCAGAAVVWTGARTVVAGRGAVGLVRTGIALGEEDGLGCFDAEGLGEGDGLTICWFEVGWFGVGLPAAVGFFFLLGPSISPMIRSTTKRVTIPMTTFLSKLPSLWSTANQTTGRTRFASWVRRLPS